MKKLLSITGIFTMSIMLLISCSANNDESNGNTEAQDNQNQEDNNSGSENDLDNEDDNDSTEDDGSTTGLPEKEDFNDDNDSNGSSESNLGEGTTEDQIDLTIGDTATIETTLGMAEVTLKNIEMKESIDEQSPELDLFVIADVSVKNISEHSQKIEDIVGTLEITPDLEGSGYSEVSMHYTGVETFSGEIGSDDTVDGQLLFQSVENSEQIIRVNPGLVSSEAVKNDVRWTFTESETN